MQPSVQLWPALGDALSHLPDMLEGVRLWREKILYPWKFNRVKHNDVELQRQVGILFAAFRLMRFASLGDRHACVVIVADCSRALLWGPWARRTGTCALTGLGA